jgi:glycerophosphoryl diester phosphodiesterase
VAGVRDMSKNFAHRGFSGKYPENTLLAFGKAIEAGCDGIELDVHLSKDGELVIIHDELVDRTTNGRGLVADYTLAELQKLDASAGYSGVYGKNKIPTLQAYFELIKDTNIVTNIELKTGVNPYPGIEEKTLAMIDAYGLRDRIIISSFNHYSVLRMQALAPDMQYGFLEESWIVDMADYTAAHGVQCIHPIFNAIDEAYVKAAREKGLAINTWTVNAEEDIRRMVELGIDGIIGNYPDLIGKVIKEVGK